MKSKITRGKGFRGALDYAFDVGKDATHDKEAELIGGNMGGENPRELAHEFGAVRAIRPDIEKPVWHSSLRCPAGETPTDEKWNAIAKDYMQGLGFDTEKTPYCIVRHKDNHVHIVASRINLDGGLYLGKNEHLKATRLTQELEKAHGLTITKGPEYTIDQDGKERVKMPDRKKPRSKELKMMERTGKPSPRMQLQDIIDKATADRPTQKEYEKRLEEAGVEWRKGSNGYSYSIEGKDFKASRLGDAYKWDRFQDRLDLGQDVTKDKAQEKEPTQPAQEKAKSLADEINAAGRERLPAAKGELEAEREKLKGLYGDLAGQKKEIYERLDEINKAEAEDRNNRLTGNEGKGFGPTVELLYKIAAMIDKIMPDVAGALRQLERETLKRELDEIKKQMEPLREEMRLNRFRLQGIKADIREVDLSTRTTHRDGEKAAHEVLLKQIESIRYEQFSKPYWETSERLEKAYKAAEKESQDKWVTYRDKNMECERVSALPAYKRIFYDLDAMKRDVDKSKQAYDVASDRTREASREHLNHSSRGHDWAYNSWRTAEKHAAMVKEAEAKLTPSQARDLEGFRRVAGNQITTRNQEQERQRERQKELQKQRGPQKGKGMER